MTVRDKITAAAERMRPWCFRFEYEFSFSQGKFVGSKNKNKNKTTYKTQFLTIPFSPSSVINYNT